MSKENPHDITHEQLVELISQDVISELMTNGGKGVRSAVYLGLIHYENWKTANKKN